MSGGVARAVGRRLAHHQVAAEEEVDRILAAALVVMERAYPESARVIDIVAEAGTSNQTFYKYFPSKADLAVAVMERGVGRLSDYLGHQMAKVDDPRQRIERWIEGVLAQVSDRRAARGSLAAIAELDRAGSDPTGLRRSTVLPVRDLLIEPLTSMGCRDPHRAADVTYEAVFGTMRRHLFERTTPEATERDHLVAFCLAGIEA